VGNGVKVKAELASVDQPAPSNGTFSTGAAISRRAGPPALAAVADLIFPPLCVACRAEIERYDGWLMLCPTCDKQLAISDRPMCRRCAGVCSTADLPRGDCSDCRARKLLFVEARAIGPYDGDLRNAVLDAKHERREALAAALGQRLAQAIENKPFQEPPEVVVPVPMHWMKRFWRGTNPASTLAGALARRLELPIARGALRCIRPLARQATLTAPERRRNVRGAFRASRPNLFTGKRVLLIDDVMTTGATAHECSKVLLGAGAAAVFVATVARSGADV
jgi:ComF family protein